MPADGPMNETTEGVRIPIKWQSPDDETFTVYANQLVISNAGPQFYLLFGEVVPPLTTEQADLPKELPVNVVARIAVAPEAMIEMAKAIHENVTRYQDRPKTTRRETDGR